MVGGAVVDDGVLANIGDSFVVFVDGGVLGVDVRKIGAVVLVDVAVPNVLVDGDASVFRDCRTRGIKIENEIMNSSRK